MIHRWLGHDLPYLPVWQAMRDFTEGRDAETPDEIWLVEHAPVYTLGQAGKPEHLLNPGAIELVQCDRGGQITYHGPGQVVAYCLIDLKRRGIFVKEYVEMLEDALIGLLDELGAAGARRKPGAPGVYLPYDAARARPDPQGSELAKIAALGIKIRNGRSYHGLALNVDMDLTPFEHINPCGYAGMATVDLRRCGLSWGVPEVGERLVARLKATFKETTACSPSLIP